MLIQTPGQWENLMDQLHQGPKHHILDLETQGLDPYREGHRLVGAAIRVFEDEADDEGEAFYAPFRHTNAESTNLPIECLHHLAPILEDEERCWINHRVKFDAHFMAAEGIVTRNRHVCTLLAAHLNNENAYSYKLENIAELYGYQDAGSEEEALRDLAIEKYGLPKRHPKFKADMAMYLPEEVAPYACRDTELAWFLYKKALAGAEKQDLLELYDEICEYAGIGWRMEMHGVLIDPETCEQKLELARQRCAELKEQMFALAGYEFNPGSWQQLQKVLDTRGSTDREHLEMMDHPIAPLVNEWRQWARSDSNYFGKFLRMMDADNRLHADLALEGTISGRLSCRNPPLQAIPRESDIYLVREVFIAPPGYTLVSADYSQIELRILAFYTKDENLISAYRGGVDIHTQTAMATGLDRDKAPGAKTLNFASVYGIGEDGVMYKFRKTPAEAQALLAAFHGQFPGIRPLYYRCERFAKRHGYIPMWTGRRRHIGRREEPHKAMSNLIQGGVAELMRVAITRLDRMFRGSQARMVMQIHDDILFEIPTEDLDHWLPRIKHVMEDFDFDPVPIVTEVKYGQRWGGSMTKWKPGDALRV